MGQDAAEWLEPDDGKLSRPVLRGERSRKAPNLPGQLQEYDLMVRAIALYSIVAWRILWMTYQVREDPDQPCSVVFSPEEEEAFRKVYERQRPKKGPRSQPLAPDHRLTLGEAMHTMAKLGGFLGRKSDGEPGVKTLWRGYRALQLIVLGMQLASSEHLGP